MLRRLLCLSGLYRFSRSLARFNSQTILGGLPWDFLFLRKSKTPFEDLPRTPEERLGRFLEQSGPGIQTLAAFFALYPDAAGRGRADLLARAADTMTVFADAADQNEQKQFVRILKIFYTLAGRDPFFKQLAENFEHILGAEVDFRFEAAALERLNDHFYEDDCLKTLLPDWPRTSKDRLVLLSSPDLLPLPDTPVSTTRPVSGSVTFRQRSACTLFFPAEDSSAAFFSWIIERPILSLLYRAIIPFA